MFSLNGPRRLESLGIYGGWGREGKGMYLHAVNVEIKFIATVNYRVNENKHYKLSV